jgi:hypothetical protein
VTDRERNEAARDLYNEAAQPMQVIMMETGALRAIVASIAEKGATITRIESARESSEAIERAIDRLARVLDVLKPGRSGARPIAEGDAVREAETGVVRRLKDEYGQTWAEVEWPARKAWNQRPVECLVRVDTADRGPK